MADPSRDNRFFEVIRGGKTDSDQPNVRIQQVVFSGGSGGKPPVDSETKNYVDAKAESVSAQNSASFAKLEAKIDAQPKPATIWQIAGVAGATLTAALAIAAFASDRFDGGIAASSLVDAAVNRISEEQAARDAEQDANMQRILNAIKQLEAIAEPTEVPSE